MGKHEVRVVDPERAVALANDDGPRERAPECLVAQPVDLLGCPVEIDGRGHGGNVGKHGDQDLLALIRAAVQAGAGAPGVDLGHRLADGRRHVGGGLDERDGSR